MPIPVEVQELLRQCSKDEAAYQELMALFQAQPSLPPIQVTESLRESELRYRTLFEQMDDAVFIHDLEGRYIQVNQRAVEMMGYQPEEIIGLGVHDLSAEPAQSADIMQRLLTGEPVPFYERLFCRKDGTTFPAEVNVKVVKDHAGNPLHIQSIVRDITARKQVAAALEKHILALTTLQAGALEITSDMDVTTVLHRIMARATDLFNAERGGGIYLYDAAQNVLQLKEATGINEGRIGITLRVDEGVAGRIFQTGQPLIVNDYTTWKDRTTVLVTYPPSAVMGVPLRIQGQVAGALLVFTNSHQRIFGPDDVRLAEMFAAQAAIAIRNAQLYSAAQQEIAERIEAQEALLEREGRIRALIEAIPDLIFRVRADGTFLDYHALDPQMLLAPPEAFLGKTITDIMPAPHACAVIPIIQQVIANKQASKHEYELTTPDGVRHFESRIVPSGPDEVLLIARDVTEQRQARQRELDLALEKERVKLVTTFIQNAAHEFRTPLAAINSFAYLISQTDDPERRMGRLDQIRMQVKRITTLVDMLLTAVKLDSHDDLVCVWVDPGAIFQAVCRKAIAEYGDKPELCVEVQTGLPGVMANVDYLAAAVKQLLDNSYRFTPPDGTITVTAGTADSAVWLEVRDTGPGIAEDALPHIFETFWRQDEAHTVPGFGLGLPVAQKIIARHGGQITVKTQIQQGSCFRITLPIASQC